MIEFALQRDPRAVAHESDRMLLRKLFGSGKSKKNADSQFRRLPCLGVGAGVGVGVGVTVGVGMASGVGEGVGVGTPVKT